MTKDTREIFVKNLRSLMADKNKQQSDLAKDLNLPFTTIANWYHILFLFFQVQKPEALDN